MTAAATTGRRGARPLDCSESHHELLGGQLDVRLTDSALRDGSHAKRHQFTEDDVRAVVAALDEAGMPVIEVSHGDGLGGSSFTYGFSRTDERDLIKVGRRDCDADRRSPC